MITKLKGQIDIEKYAGKWHEIASFPSWFQRGCKDTTAKYTLKNDRVIIKNECSTNIGKISIKGTAIKTNKSNVLAVQFFPFTKAGYIIEFVDANYNFAVVGTENKKYLWILARTKVIEEKIYDHLVAIAERKGYDTSKLVKN